MLKHYLTAAWRNIMRYKMFSAINVFGLSLGISACLVIYLIASFELSFDNYHSGKGKIYRIVCDMSSANGGENYSGSIPSPAPSAIRNEVAGLEALTVFDHYDASVIIREQGKPDKKIPKLPPDQAMRSDIILTDQQYFHIFQYHWLAGNPRILNDPNMVVLTESKARKYFGEANLAAWIDRTIIYDDSLPVKVGGIIQDPQSNSDLFFQDFISWKTIKKEFQPGSWNGSLVNQQVFVKLAENTQPVQIEAQLAKIVARNIPVTAESKTSLVLQPLSSLHFDNRYEDTYTRKAYLPTLYGLMAIALFILALAVINFITLSTAQSIDRAKETGIRKICGSSANGLLFRFLGETFILTGLAFVVSVASIHPLLLAFKSYIPEGVTFSFFSSYTWIFLIAITFLTALLAGFYPAKVLSSSKAIINLKGSGAQKWNKGGYFIKGLVVFQFTISIAFIIAAMVTGKQMRFVQNKDLGFRKDAIITVHTSSDQSVGRKNILAEKLRQLPEVKAVSFSEGTPLSKLHFFVPLISKGKEEKEIACILEWGDEHFLPLYDIKLLAGRNILPSDSIREFLVNESCAKALGFTNPGEAIGKMVETIMPGNPIQRPIVGVISDFHSQSLHEQIKPVALTTSIEFSRLLNIRLATNGKENGHLKGALAKIEKCWKEIYPDAPFDYEFFDETIGRFYEKEKQTATLTNIAVAISISISCLGLFAQATLTTRRRTKEISIRKVLGINTAQIIYLLGKETIMLVSIAVVIAASITWHAMKQWLNGFAFRIEMNGWIIAEAGAMAILIAFCTVSYRSIKAVLMNPVDALQRD
ncbi:MAG: ABC transporter permease [Chitinophagaceae bacterium]|nr:ABC transporter permease [Chitinophagaceae bacterium]